MAVDLIDVEMFLMIVQTKSISKTADALFLSQPTVSHRLKAMERELDFPLITRSKGFKQIELTPEGVEFIPIAQRMFSLWKETRLLKRARNRVRLSVGCTDSANTALLAPFYRELTEEDTALDLNIQTHQSTELYGILNAHDIDVAFVFYRLYYKNILCEQIFQERFYLVQSARPAVSGPLVSTEDLDPAKELFLKWDDNYQLWHDQRFADGLRPRIRADTAMLLYHLWQGEDRWMIAPESVVCQLSRLRPVYVSALREPPPDRRCYKITHRFPLAGSESALDHFGRKLAAYLQTLQFDIPLGEVFRT